jgi:hypothetical protein
MIRSWPSVASLLPRGLNIIWGDENGSPDDIDELEEREKEAEERESESIGLAKDGESQSSVDNDARRQASALEKQAEKLPSSKYILRFTSMPLAFPLLFFIYWLVLFLLLFCFCLLTL